MLQKLSDLEIEQLSKIAKPEYLTARQLGIKSWLRQGLIKTLEAFKNGTIKEDTEENFRGGDAKLYNQAEEYLKEDCGTAACILGWAYLFAGMDIMTVPVINTTVYRNSEISKIYDPRWNLENDIQLAIQVLETYLTTGKGPTV